MSFSGKSLVTQAYIRRNDSDEAALYYYLLASRNEKNENEPPYGIEIVMVEESGREEFATAIVSRDLGETLLWIQKLARNFVFPSSLGDLVAERDCECA